LYEVRIFAPMKARAQQVASMLLRIEAIRLQPDRPFTWTSGWKSPIYCDNRLSLSYPDVRAYVRDSLIQVIRERFPEADSVAGVATAGIPQAALVADHLGLPMQYVRGASKGHGLQNRIEGEITPGQKIVVIEDLISTGKSSLSAVEALREAGAEVLGLCAVFSYDFDAAKAAFEAQSVPCAILSDYATLIEIALEQGRVAPETAETLAAWRESPSTWGV